MSTDWGRQVLLTAYRNGLSMGTPPGKNDHERAKRGQVEGWSPSAVRRHTRWLYSINAPALDGTGIAATLTLRDCPPDSDVWRAMLRAWITRVERSGALRIHWVVEWTRRGVPHVHAAVYYPEGVEEADAGFRVIAAWLAVAGPHGALPFGQHWNPITGALGWLGYLSKHAARGVRHYQRSGKPEGWTTTGRLWGHRGEWPEEEPLRFSIDRAGSYRMRRWVRGWRIADARAAYSEIAARPVPRDPELARKHQLRVVAARRRIGSARRLLKRSERFSAVQGVSEWVPEHLALSMLASLVDDGHAAVQEDSPAEPASATRK